MSHPVIVRNKFITTLLTGHQRHELTEMNLRITKDMVERICPDIQTGAQLSSIIDITTPNTITVAIPSSNDNTNKTKPKESTVKQVLNAIAPTNQIFYGTTTCLNLIDIRFHGIDNSTLLHITKNYHIIWPWSIQYDSLRLGNNNRLNRFPLMIVFPRKVKTVQFFLAFVQTYKFSLSIRSGGHNYEYYSGENQVIMDLSYLRLPKKLQKHNHQIAINDDKQYLDVSPGARLGLVYFHLDKHKSVIAGGICPSVCTGGLIAGGGVGYFIRKFGFACDNLIEVELVLSNGKQIVATSTNKYSDLFKAIKGAGQNFGVITRYRLKTYPVHNLVFFSYTFDLEDFVNIMLQWQTFVPIAPDNLAGMVIAVAVGLNVMLINGFYVSDGKKNQAIAEFTQLFSTGFLQPLSQQDIEPVSFNIEYISFLQAESRIALELPNMPFYKIKSSYFFEPISASGWTNILNALTAPFPFDPTQALMAIQIPAYKGAVNKIPSDTSVIANRTCLGGFQMAIYFNNQDLTPAALATLNNLYNTIISVSTTTADPNTSDSDLIDFMTAYYGNNNINFLTTTKRKYDPTNLFKFRQSIPLI